MASSFFVLLLGAGYAVPAYAQAVAEPAPPALQTVTVSALATHALVGHDSYSVTDPPPLQWPVSPSSPIADGFGPRAAPCAGCSTYHEGVDFDEGGATGTLGAKRRLGPPVRCDFVKRLEAGPVAHPRLLGSP